MDNVDERHQSHKNIGHSIPQTPVHHQSRSPYRGSCYCSSRQVCGPDQRFHATPPQRNNPRQLERIETILQQDWTQKYQQNPPRNLPTPPLIQNRKVQAALLLKLGVGLPVPLKLSNLRLLLKPTKPAPLAKPLISLTITPPRVLPLLRAAHPVEPRRSPRLAYQRSEK